MFSFIDPNLWNLQCTSLLKFPPAASNKKNHTHFKNAPELQEFFFNSSAQNF